MKIVIALVVFALIVIAAVLFFGGGDLDLVPKKTPAAEGAAAATQKLDFAGLATLLEKDMASIPLALDAPRVAPNNAFSVKSRLGNAGGERQEYQVLVQACDLIIYADQEHAVHQLKDQQAQQEVFTDLMTSPGSQQTVIATRRAAIHARSQSDWENYRRQTDAEVKRLLSSLPGAKP